MSAQTATIVSGIVLLVVFILVGWNLRRRNRSGQEQRRKDARHDD
ncbi:hypothetical protein [Desulfurivibrio sp. C05AmB]|jgi:FtsZ-interacting cell division protein ZipA